MEDMGDFWHHYCSWHLFTDLCCLNFNILAWLEVCQELPCHHQWLGGYWGFLTRDMEDMSHPWPQNSSRHLITNVCVKCQYSRVIRSGSRTPCPWWVHLEDVDGLYQKTWRTGSSLTPWITLDDTKEDILKVLCHYLYFCLRYKGVLPW